MKVLWLVLFTALLFGEEDVFLVFVDSVLMLAFFRFQVPVWLSTSIWMEQMLDSSSSRAWARPSNLC